MELSCLPDFDRVRERYNAFWYQAVIDRPPVSIVLPGPAAPPAKAYATHRDRWLDFEARADAIDHAMRSARFLYDALPVVIPDLGPTVFSACCGCDYEFGADTAWAHPLIEDWETDADKARLNMDHPLFRGLIDFTRALLARARGAYLVGLTDMHPGGDHLAALRGAENLAVDLLEEPEAVKAMLSQSMAEYYAFYGVFYQLLRAEGLPVSSWTPLIHDGTYYIPSNDFSCMISSDMFNEFFLPGIAQECRFYERSIYHLDGPGALRHLDALLSIPELDAVQWIPGAGNEGFARWAGVYQRIQRASKSLQLTCDVRELPQVFEALRPEGVWFSTLTGVPDEDTARLAVERIAAWR